MNNDKIINEIVKDVLIQLEGKKEKTPKFVGAFKKAPTIVAVSGYFDPIHKGHIEYFKKARELAGENGSVVCILNNDEQALLKKPKIFMPGRKKNYIGSIRKYRPCLYIN